MRNPKYSKVVDAARLRLGRSDVGADPNEGHTASLVYATLSATPQTAAVRDIASATRVATAGEL